MPPKKAKQDSWVKENGKFKGEVPDDCFAVPKKKLSSKLWATTKELRKDLDLTIYLPEDCEGATHLCTVCTGPNEYCNAVLKMRWLEKEQVYSTSTEAAVSHMCSEHPTHEFSISKKESEAKKNAERQDACHHTSTASGNLTVISRYQWLAMQAMYFINRRGHFYLNASEDP